MEKQNRIQLVKSIVQKLNDGTYQEAAQVAQAIDRVIMSFWESGKLLRQSRSVRAGPGRVLRLS